MGRPHTETFHPGYEGGPHGYAHGAAEIEELMRTHPDQVNYWDYVEHPQYFADYWGVNRQYIPGFLQAGLEYTGMIEPAVIDAHPDVEIGTSFASLVSPEADDMVTGTDTLLSG